MALAASTLPPLGSIVLFWNITPVSQWLRSHAGSGPVIYALAFVVLGALALMPTYAFALLGGWAFGFGVGYAAAMVGFVLASMLAYWIGAIGSGDRVVRLLEENVRWKAVYDALLRGGFGYTLFIITLLRLPPNSPFAVTNLVLSSAKANIGAYALGTLLGMAPRTALAVYLGSHLSGEFRRPDVGWLPWAGMGVALVVILVIGQVARRAIEKATSGTPGESQPTG
jgi:uncharacterized membrane protein YdjX (TVP38/TMEM64 family)